MTMREGHVIAGKYRMIRQFAQGGMGAVWIAHHVTLDTEVAVKLLSKEYADATGDARVRFEREAKAAALLKSPHVVHVHDFGIDDGTPYIVMELLAGEDLGARLKRVGSLSLSETARVLAPVCKALRAAHAAGLVHRDLKPANVFLARFGPDEVVKVLDFGIAKSVRPELAGEATKSDVLMGSPHYMSPEQVRARRDIDARSDVWALGVIAFKCLFGRVPFPGSEIGDVFVAICSDEVPMPSRIAKGASPALDAFFTRALERDIERRFQSAEEFAAALDGLAAAAGGGAMLATPLFEHGPSVTSDRLVDGTSTQTGAPTGRTLAVSRRRRGVAVATLLAALAAIGGATAATLWSRGHASAPPAAADPPTIPEVAPLASAPPSAPAPLDPPQPSASSSASSSAAAAPTARRKAPPAPRPSSPAPRFDPLREM